MLGLVGENKVLKFKFVHTNLQQACKKNSHPDISSVTMIDFRIAFFKKGPYDELGGHDNPLSIPIF